MNQTARIISIYTADTSGFCSALYEYGGMTVIHDASGCNSTYTTHDEPRWSDTESLMFVSGLDEMEAVYGDDSVLIDHAVRAAGELKPKFITLCGASIPHITAFDYRGVSRLIEKKTGIPVLPVKTDGLKSYVSGVGLATREWIRRFARTDVQRRQHSVNLLGVTPVDFSSQENVEDLKDFWTDSGWCVNTCFAMGDCFENLQGICAGSVNLVVSSAGRIPAVYLQGKENIPFVEGLPVGPWMRSRLIRAAEEAEACGQNVRAYEEPADDAAVLVIGEEIYARSLATEINHSAWAGRNGCRAKALWPDVNEGLDEDDLTEAIEAAKVVVADPLFRVVCRKKGIRFAEMPHEGYSGRLFRDKIPRFLAEGFEIGELLEAAGKLH
jgi:nitrogenase molybdenum-iron protein alpha/beta subunit